MYDETRDWITANWDESITLREWWARMLAARLSFPRWPTEWFGRDCSQRDQNDIAQAFGDADVLSAPTGLGVLMGAPVTMTYGTQDQKQRWLPSLADGTEGWCQLFSEPGAGSDLGGLSTRAELDGDRYIINGQKVWCSGGRYSNWGILMARTNPEAAKHDGISFFLFPMNLPGVEVRPLRQMTGEAEFDEVFFTDVELPADHLLGPLHGGWGVGMAVLTSERGHIGTSVIGLDRRLEAMARLAEGRELGTVERDRLTRLLATGQAYKAMARRQGPIASTAASLMKLGITEMMFETAMLRAELAGADSMLDGPESFGMLQAPGGRIAGGTSQVQRNIIGERLLGLPREPKG